MVSAAGKGYVYMSLVGTSILRNVVERIKDRWLDRYPDMVGWHSLPLEDSRNAYPDGLLCRMGETDAALYGDMLKAASSLGYRASAEVSGLVGLASTLSHSYRDVQVVLYPTASCSSYLSAQLNASLLRSMGFESVEVKVLERLGRPGLLNEGLIELLDKTVPLILEASRAGRDVYLNAAPGFKAESSFLVLASLLAGAKGVIYIHETFRDPVFLPAIPLKVDERFVEIIESFGDAMPEEAWESVDHHVRRELVERGIVARKGEVYVVRPWVRELVKSLATSR